MVKEGHSIAQAIAAGRCSALLRCRFFSGASITHRATPLHWRRNDENPSYHAGLSTSRSLNASPLLIGVLPPQTWSNASTDGIAV
ncbi:hypothetical protein SAMN05444172_9421 [Burkholderia sp. GAS332]|nr:hypothetical protein SAMN05444172_9421 [Burkholderia sp. GAS332]